MTFTLPPSALFARPGPPPPPRLHFRFDFGLDLDFFREPDLDDVPLEPQLFFAEAHGKADGLGDIYDRYGIFLSRGLVDEIAPHVKIGVAHGAGHDDSLGAFLHRVADDLARQLADQVGAGYGMAGAAALDLEVPVKGLCPDHFHEVVHGARVFGPVEIHHLGRPHQEAAVVAGDVLIEGRRDLVLECVRVALEELQYVQGPDGALVFHPDYFIDARAQLRRFP